MIIQHTARAPGNRPWGVQPLAGAFAIAVGLLVALQAAPASGQDFSLHVEPAAGFWLAAPQKDRFTPGFYAAVRPSLSLGSVAAAQLSYAFAFSPADSDFDDAGSAHLLTAGLRFRPFAPLRPPTENLGGLWADINAGYARTGSLDRFTFDTGLGYGFQVSPTFALGPALRYVQIVQANDIEGIDTRDARLLTTGINFTFGPAYRPAEATEVVTRVPAAPCVEEECVQQDCAQRPCPALARSTCVDTDGDGVCDSVDRCPNVAGPVRTFGCPTNPCDGAPIRVLVQFDFDSANMPVIRSGDAQTMDPVLDAVAAAIAENPTCRVGIRGHASEEGDAAHNQRLSEARALAVQRYMVANGINANRIPTIGLGDRCQLSPERSRVLNRRVEFFRLEEGAPMPTECLP